MSGDGDGDGDVKEMGEYCANLTWHLAQQPFLKASAMQLSTLSDSWAWETLSLASCIICCTALAALLTRSNGNDAPQLPYQISLNTLASILATAAKASLLTVVAAVVGQNKWLKLRSEKAVTRVSAVKLFDDGSRGPTGALVLLFVAGEVVLLLY